MDNAECATPFVRRHPRYVRDVCGVVVILSHSVTMLARLPARQTKRIRPENGEI